MKNPNVLNKFLEYLTNKKRSINTIESYGRFVSEFLKYVQSNKYGSMKKNIRDVDISRFSIDKVKTINKKDIEGYIGWLNSIGDKGTTINRKLAGLETFDKYLIGHDIISINRFGNIERETESKKVVHSLSLKQTKDLLSVIKSENGKHTQRDLCMVQFYIETGLRLSELRNLTMNQIVNMEYIKFYGKGNKERSIYLSDKFKTVLQEYLQLREKFLNKKNLNIDYVFFSQKGTQFSRNGIYTIIKNYGIKAGIKAEDIHPHTLRHTAVTLKHKYGKIDVKNLQVMCGHSSILTTQQYIDVDEEEMKTTANSFSVVGL